MPWTRRPLPSRRHHRWVQPNHLRSGPDVPCRRGGDGGGPLGCCRHRRTRCPRPAQPKQRGPQGEPRSPGSRPRRPWGCPRQARHRLPQGRQTWAGRWPDSLAAVARQQRAAGRAGRSSARPPSAGMPLRPVRRLSRLPGFPGSAGSATATAGTAEPSGVACASAESAAGSAAGVTATAATARREARLRGAGAVSSAGAVQRRGGGQPRRGSVDRHRLDRDLGGCRVARGGFGGSGLGAAPASGPFARSSGSDSSVGAFDGLLHRLSRLDRLEWCGGRGCGGRSPRGPLACGSSRRCLGREGLRGRWCHRRSRSRRCSRDAFTVCVGGGCRGGLGPAGPSGPGRRSGGWLCGFGGRADDVVGAWLVVGGCHAASSRHPHGVAHTARAGARRLRMARFASSPPRVRQDGSRLCYA